MRFLSFIQRIFTNNQMDTSSTDSLDDSLIGTDGKYSDLEEVDEGAFGVVYKATESATGRTVAIKKFPQRTGSQSRELLLMKQVSHINVVQFLDSYVTPSREHHKGKEVLSIVMEYVPTTLYRIVCTYSRRRKCVPTIFIKLYMYQLFKALEYIHSLNICHRDIKPRNMLIEPETHVLKLCDFGSAKKLSSGEENKAYICPRSYRPPELALEATDYTCQVDCWSAGCIVAELLLDRVLFCADDRDAHVYEIVRLLGTPTPAELLKMKVRCSDKVIKSLQGCERRKWSDIFRPSKVSQDAVDVVSSLLKYAPLERATPTDTCRHAFFNELRNPGLRLPDGKKIPDCLFEGAVQKFVGSVQETNQTNARQRQSSRENACVQEVLSKDISHIDIQSNVVH